MKKVFLLVAFCLCLPTTQMRSDNDLAKILVGVAVLLGGITFWRFSSYGKSTNAQPTVDKQLQSYREPKENQKNNLPENHIEKVEPKKDLGNTSPEKKSQKEHKENQSRLSNLLLDAFLVN